MSRMPVSVSLGSDASLSAEVFAEVNSYRASKGKAALQRHAGLDKLAQQHCDHLAKTAGSYGIYGKDISHVGFEGRAVVARQAYKIDSLGENVVSSTTHSAKHLVKLWAGSKSHDHNMKADWAHTGIATAVTADGKVISTQLFGTNPSSSHLLLKQRMNRDW
ncbi:CAP domain-containing protein [Akkermansiaceae bacterium]|nr:CAP domain-containing protein [Akkermansiaceae bacterium]